MRRPLFVSGLFHVLAALAFTSCNTGSDPVSSATPPHLAAVTAPSSVASAPLPTPVARAIAPAARPTSMLVPTRPAARGRDAYVLLSGGGTPLSNNYSQYLQARALAAFFEREFPPEATWVFFGVGNREGATPLLADARREIKRDGRLIESWLPGSLKNNRPATRDSFLRALRDEILPRVREGGTLYLFVGDHGELNGEGAKRESAITLWQLKHNRRRSGGWSTDDNEILGVGELRQVLADGLGEGRIVFGMTQCHGGGFHELGVAREMVPLREWFTGAPPSWAVGEPRGLNLRIAGFTATDEASPAAGCDADPDPERWAGYERFLPESLLGLDLMTGQRKNEGTRSLAEAHESATLVDQTIDKPRSTSEHYLEAWARLIESRLSTSLGLTARTLDAVQAFERSVDRGGIATDDPALRARQQQFARFTQRLAEQVPSARTLLLNGTRQQLESAIGARGERGGGGRGGRRGSMGELRRAWADTLRPAWKAAVLAHRVPGLTGSALEFEKRILKLEDGGRDLLLPRGGDDTPLLNEIYWDSSYAEPAGFDRAKAEAVTLWGAERRPRIIAWARTSSDPQVRAAAEKIGPGPAFADEPPRPLSRKTAAERVLFYRRVLAAWEFLVTLQAQPALTELETLLELERMPLRPGS